MPEGIGPSSEPDTLLPCSTEASRVRAFHAPPPHPWSSPISTGKHPGPVRHAAPLLHRGKPRQRAAQEKRKHAFVRIASGPSSEPTTLLPCFTEPTTAISARALFLGTTPPCSTDASSLSARLKRRDTTRFFASHLRRPRARGSEVGRQRGGGVGSGEERGRLRGGGGVLRV